MLSNGMRLRGSCGVYRVGRRIGPNVWKATTLKENIFRATREKERVIIKSYPNEGPFLNERYALAVARGEQPIRQVIDEIKHGDKVGINDTDKDEDVNNDEGLPILVLEHHDKTLLELTRSKRLTTEELKYVAKQVLRALAFLHRKGIAHMDVKPDNILANLSWTPQKRFKEVKLADLGFITPSQKSHSLDLRPYNNAFRSPELLLDAPFDASTDIWSLGATLISLARGRKQNIFGTMNSSVLSILQRQTNWFGMPPERLKGFIVTGPLQDEYLFPTNPALGLNDRLYKGGHIARRMYESLNKYQSLDAEFVQDLAEGDVKFTKRMMKVDPSERPSADELLKDDWITQDPLSSSS